MRFTVSLQKNHQFRTVYNRGRSFANHRLVLIVLPNGRGANRLGISVSKKVGNSVVRSRVTRLIREGYRLSEHRVKPGFDLVFIARASAAGATYNDMNASLLHLLKKQGLLSMEAGGSP